LGGKSQRYLATVVKPALFQQISVLVQRFNATLLHESFADENRSDD